MRVGRRAMCNVHTCRVQAHLMHVGLSNKAGTSLDKFGNAPGGLLRGLLYFVCTKEKRMVGSSDLVFADKWHSIKSAWNCRIRLVSLRTLVCGCKKAFLV